MRLRILIGAGLLAVLGAASGVEAQTPLASPLETVKPAEPGKAAFKEPLVCKSSLVTGSRVRKQKTCLTQSQWLRKGKGSEGFADELGRERENTINPRPAGG